MREQFRIVRDALALTGLPWRIVPGGKHLRAEVEAYGGVVVVPIAGSPRDRANAGRNSVKQIRRGIDEAAARAGQR